MTSLRTVIRAQTKTQRLTRVLALALAVIPLSGCGAFKSPFARVESVTVRDQYDASPQTSHVRVIRAGTVVSPSVSMRLEQGDSITTSATTRLVIEFGVGYRVTLDTSTSIYLETDTNGARLNVPGDREQAAYLNRVAGTRLITNRATTARLARNVGADGRTEGIAGPFTSLFLRIGRAFVERVRGTPDSLTLGTPGARLHIVGTRLLVSVNLAARTAVTVAEGTVRAESTDPADRWPPITYTSLQHGEYGGGSRPGPVRPIQPQQLETQLRWVRDVERLTRIPVPRLDSLTLDEARARLDRVGLRVLIVRHKKTGLAAPERVVGQEPSAGDSVAPGTYINLVLESAPRPTPGAENVSTCTVPKITGLTRAAAERLLKSKGLKGQGTSEEGEVDRVLSQVEAADRQLPCGSVVRYKFGVIG